MASTEPLSTLMGVLGHMRDVTEKLAASRGDAEKQLSAVTDASLTFLDLRAWGGGSN